MKKRYSVALGEDTIANSASLSAIACPYFEYKN